MTAEIIQRFDADNLDTMTLQEAVKILEHFNGIDVLNAEAEVYYAVTHALEKIKENK